MFKKRPRLRRPAEVRPAREAPPSKMEPDYWPERLFRNTFTYKGRRVKVRGWSVKIQLFGKRKTFSLGSSDRSQAAAEACSLYQTIATQGWDAVAQRQGRVTLRSQLGPIGGTASAGNDLDLDSWKRRLIYRPYPRQTDPRAMPELSVRIEHGGINRYFPLRTLNESAAAAAALRIHRCVTGQGWLIANQKYSRELTLAFRWLDDPLAWTYTTIHTWKDGDARPAAGDVEAAGTSRNIVVIEPDEGIRLALASCVNNQPGFRCRAVHAGTAEALRDIAKYNIDLVLANYSLPNQPGSACLQELRQTRPGLVGLLYSVFEDSDIMFKSTPGGSAGYMLRRTPNFRIFDPIASTSAPLTRELIATCIREYFQKLVEAMPVGPSLLEMAKLTPREHEILALLAKGYLAKEIADSLGISIWTVHGHAKSIFEKLNVHTRTEAVVKFLQK
ncbi:MAG: response regulator transcription factor [Verrucomicrobiota bacterium]